MPLKKVLVIGVLPPPTGGMETVMLQMMGMTFEHFKLYPFNTVKSPLERRNILVNILAQLWRYVRLFFKCPFYDVLHIHISDGIGFWQRAVYTVIGKLFFCKVVYHMHGAVFKEFYAEQGSLSKAMIKWLCNLGDRMIVLSEKWQEFYSQFVDPRKIVIINNAVQLPAFPENKSSNEVLFLGHVCERKGIYDLLEAIKIVKQPALFTIIGPFEDEDRFNESIEDIPSDRINVIGEVVGDEKFEYFSRAAMYILPSYAEGLPVAILEAMSYGNPIISTRVGGIPEVILEENGMLITPGDVPAMAACLDTLLSDSLLRNAMSRANYEKIRDSFTVTKFNEELERVYNSLYPAIS